MVSDLFYVFLTSTGLLVLSLFLSRDRIGFYLVLSSFIYLTNFLWIPLNWLAGKAIGTEILTEDIHIVPLWGAVGFYASFVIFTGLLCVPIRRPSLPVYQPSTNHLIIAFALVFFFMAIAGYIALNGMSFSAGNYGHRLKASAGNGIFMIFFFLFIPASLLILLLKQSNTGLFYALILAFIGGMLVYFTLGGSRNILAAGIIGLIIIAQRLELLSMKSIIAVAGLLIIAVNYLAFVRYGQDLSDDILALGFRYLIDSLSPYDSFNEIITFFESGDEEFKGFDFVLAQFNPLIPRAFWPEKPVVPLTNAFYFTETILGIKAGTYIISPTLLGGLFIMGGWYGVFFGGLVLIFFTTLMERMLFSNSPFWVLFLYTLLPFSFFMVRESLELFVNKGILKFFTLIFIIGIVFFFQEIINAMNKRLLMD